MLKKILFLLLFPSILSAQTNKLGTWQMHLPYRLAKNVAQNDDYVYYATGLSILKVKKSDFSTEKIDKLNTLTDISTGILRFNKQNKTLLIAYTNANIDLLRENGTVMNLPDIKNNSAIVGDKMIYDAFFVNDTAFLATGFGVVKLDMRRGEFISTTFTRLKTYSVVVFDGKIWAATEGGVFSVNNAPRTVNLADFGNWEKSTDTRFFPNNYASKAMVIFQNKLFLDINDTLKAYEPNVAMRKVRHEAGQKIGFLTTEGNNLLAGFVCDNACTDKLLVFSSETSFVSTTACTGQMLYAVEDKTGRIWFADEYLGFRHLNKPTDTNCQSFELSTPLISNASYVAANDTLVVVPTGGISGVNALDNRFGSGILRGGQWSILNGTTQPILTSTLTDLDHDMAAIDSRSGKVYITSFWGGLIELTNGNVSKIYNSINSPLRPSVADPGRTRVAGVVFDRNGNMWVSNPLVDNPIAVRKTDGTWRSFTATNNSIYRFAIDLAGNKWFIVRGFQSAILVFNEGSKIDDPSDDKQIVLDNSFFPTELQNAIVTGVMCDLDGRVWVTTTLGVMTFDCGSNLFSGNCMGKQVVSGLGGIGEYLLREKYVTCVAIDGANRKWFGTTAGVFVTDATGKDEIYKYNTENSPLPSNNIVHIGIRPNGEVFIATDKGLVSYQSNATTGGSLNAAEANIMVYPNPVRPDYSGDIAVHGFARDADIRIADVNGRVVYQTKALGGQAIWNGQDFEGQRVPSGVYLVLAANTENLETRDVVVAKILFVN